MIDEKRSTVLDAEGLLEEARQIADYADFGAPNIQNTLTAFFDHVRRCQDHSPEQLAGIRQDVLRCLINRLRFQRDLQRHPEILEEDVSDPIIILGLGRSGTTKMHKMLSVPSSVQKTTFWRLWNPAPFTEPSGRLDENDPRIAAAGTSMLVSTEDATIKAAHPMHAMEVEEEWLLYSLTFEDWIWCALLYVPSLFDWSMGGDRQAVYSYVKSVLQYLQWQDGGRRGRRWILKSVGYIADMDAVVSCYPKATFLHTHRDPRATIPSWAKFVSAIWNVRGQPVSPRQVGQDVLHQWSTAMKRYLEARDRLRLDNRILDVPYERVRQDPMGIIAELYRIAGMELSPEAQGVMAGWHESNEQYKHGRHEYSLAEFGLTEPDIDQAFAEYRARFICA